MARSTRAPCAARPLPILSRTTSIEPRKSHEAQQHRQYPAPQGCTGKDRGRHPQRWRDLFQPGRVQHRLSDSEGVAEGAGVERRRKGRFQRPPQDSPAVDARVTDRKH
jgi:hypothetical protein